MGTKIVGLQGAVSQLWLVTASGATREGVLRDSPALHVRLFSLRLNEISPGANSTARSRREALRIQSPRKRRRDEERKYTRDGALHTAAPHVCVYRGTVVILWERPPTRKAGQDSQAVCTREARAASQAGSLPRGGTRHELL